MEKFAVDLEKVLDEFEYNEEREENVSAPSIISPSLPHLGAVRQQSAVRPPAASYRRPSFEPINLAEADFAASPPKSSSHFSHMIHEKQNDIDGGFNYIGSKPQLNYRNYTITDNNVIPTFNNGVNLNKQVILESEDSSTSTLWQKEPNPHSSDEKPDLLENNSKNADINSGNLEIHNQLPDLTTTAVRTSCLSINNNEIDNSSNSLDLISSTSSNFVIDNNDMTFIKIESELYEKIKSSDTEDDVILNNKPLEESIAVNNNEDSTTLPINAEIECTTSPEATLIKLNTNTHNTIDKNCTNTLNETETIQNVLRNCDSNVQNLDKLSDGNIQMDVAIEKSGNVEHDFVAQIDTSNLIQPITFNNDVEVSEGELEEYLKELEELDESVECIKEAGSLENYVDVIEGKNVDTSTINTLDYTNPMENVNSSLNSAVRDDHEKIEPLANSVSINSKSTQNFIIENKQTDITSGGSKVNHSKEGVLKQDIGLKYENKNDMEIKSKLGEIMIEVGKSTSDESEEISTNPFDYSNSFDASVEEEMNITRKQESTNPFDEDEDSGFSEKIMPKRKSTNPFEEVDENVNIAITEKEQPFLVSSELECPKNLNSKDSKNQSKSFNKIEIPESSSIVIIKDDSNQVEDILNNSDYNVTQENSILSTLDSPEESSESDINPENLSVKNCLSAENSPHPNSSVQNDSFDGLLDSTVKMIPIKQAAESSSLQNVDEAGVPAEEEKPLRPNSLELPKKITVESSTNQSVITGELERELGPDDRRLGKIPPFWIPDTDTNMCMQCQLKFNVIKRRHHCRACGQVLCYKCCGLRARLEYMNFAEARVCQPCFTTLEALNTSESTSPLRRQPNPNNPMEYCSTIPPLQQAAGSLHQPPPSVMVPVGVLKREGRMKSEVTKQVMFSDGIRPGGDLTELDGSGEPRIPFRRPGRLTKRVGTPPGGVLSPSMRRVMDPTTLSFIPAEGENSLPPVVSRVQGEVSYSDLESPVTLQQPTIKFALNRNLFIFVKRVLLDCCVNRECWCFSSEGLACVGQDEVVFILECLPQETLPPKDVFLLINYLYQDAAKGTTVSEMSFTPAMSNNLFGSRDHGGFLYIRTSYQCTAQLVLPSAPYLVALLIHRWETPWARLFPIRLVLRLGAEFRYYPCPLVSVRNRLPLYTDIGHTIINILADFRKYSYTLPSVRGLVIHMEDRQTTINIPRNRYDQVVRALNNSNDSVLAFGANLSLAADSHLVCMQSTEDENTSYTTQAINIHNKPRRVTGASFVVFNGALKAPGLAGKSNIVEDGLMVQVPSETMVALRTALRDMRDYSIGCGPNAEETVVLQWTADDTNFNIGVKSCIDGRPLDGVPSIRVHNGTDYSGGARIIRWTEVFILQCEDSDHSSEPVDISRLSESIARATCLALVPLLDLLSAASLSQLAVRATIHPDNVGYEAGSNGEKLPPLYMKSLDDELIAVVHQAALNSQDNPATLELVFRIMEQG